MVRTVLGLIVGAGLLSATVSAQTPLRSALHDYRVVTVVDTLVQPWSIAFLPGGDALITERPGRLRIVRNGKLLPQPVEGVPAVSYANQGGLLEVATHPDFASNRMLYLTFSKPMADGKEATTALVRGRFENDRLTNVQQLFESVSKGRGHFGGKIAFDGKGFLFLTLGDRQVAPEGNLEAHPAQDLTNHHGKIVRLHDDGRVPTDNPFVSRAGARPEIWSYGHRNVQGIAIIPETGDVLATEHGPMGGDELNRILPGLNYGWPVVGFGVNYTTGLAIHKGTIREGMEQPRHVWVPSIGISGGMIYTGDRFPQWKGNYFVAGMSGQQLARLTLKGTNVVSEETLVPQMGRIRDVRQGLDGYIYLVIEDRDGKPTPVYRLEPVERK
ncbi:MAG: PQQ-dependent sugar dehydrogenase [Acidobacteria bacterium]|nr:PQQ-dependent sugar dehydrogenase [Acidobacteriota bacterium]MSO60997.1 PQQ-dependent sugar dehydrogenase [Acidobacteriota bacterium]